MRAKSLNKGKVILITLIMLTILAGISYSGTNPVSAKPIKRTPTPTIQISTATRTSTSTATFTTTPVTPTPTATATVPTITTTPSNEFINGFDASYVKRVEDKGGVYKTASGQVQDIFAILANNGVNYVRFRVWNNPADGYCNKNDVLALALRAKAVGLKILLDFHYSDSWADPSQQTKPVAWQSMSFSELNQAVYDYTYDVVSAMNAQGTAPDMVQIGNEITHGMLWPDGEVHMGDAVYDTPTQWTNLATLVNSGIDAVKDTGSSAEIMVQIAGGDLSELTWFFDNIQAYGVNPDILGISYYHYWHGDFAALDSFISTLTTRYGKEVLIVETSYPFTLNWNDWTNNILGLESQLLDGYPATQSGQKAFLQAVVDTTRNYSLGRGVFYWGGEWIATSPEDTDGSTWENQAMFDFSGKAVQAFEVFQ